MKVLESLETLKQSAQRIADERERGIQETHKELAQRIEQHLLSIVNSSTQRIERDLKTLNETAEQAKNKAQSVAESLNETTAQLETITQRARDLQAESNILLQAQAEQIEKLNKTKPLIFGTLAINLAIIVAVALAYYFKIFLVIQ